MQQMDRQPALGQLPIPISLGKKQFVYELPHDAEDVAALAGGLAYYIATAEYPHQGTYGELVRLAQEHLDTLAPSPGSFLLEIPLTNDREAFNAIFAECFVQMYHQMIDTCVREPETLQSVKYLLFTLSAEELLAYTQARAREALTGVVGITNQGQGSPVPVATREQAISLSRVLRLFSRGTS
ncbi:MAG TPA: hypothetical protein VFA10_31735 [Ktedonobacteraceae bacterium]|nr:hypothetical protein [Ktedonobacteraceae bacterium]